MPEGLPPKVVEVYRSVGKIMSRYSAGKVPKAFKIIPNLKNWEEVSPSPAQTACPLAYQLLVQQAPLLSVVCPPLQLASPGVGASV